MPTCKLCLQSVPALHPNSHIVPEWMYEDVYENPHRTIHLDVNRRQKRIVQQGLRKSMICPGCESVFSVDDGFGKKCLVYKRGIQTNDDNRLAPVILTRWRGVDFCRLRKFVYSVLIRWHLAFKDDGGIECLCKDEYDNLKHCYNVPSDGVNEYPILVDKPVAGRHMLPVTLPYMGDGEGFKVCTFIGANMRFQVFFPTSGTVPSGYRHFMLNANGEMSVLQIPFEKTELARTIGSIVRMYDQQS